MEKKFYSVRQVIENFDFEDIHKYMKSVNWTWAIPYKESAVPSIERMIEVTTYLLYDAMYKCIKEKTYSASTGGFIAKRHENGMISLSFNKKY